MVTYRSVMRLVFSLGVFCVLLIGVASANATTTTHECGTSGTFTITDNMVVSQTNCAGAITIPNTVVAIANRAFQDATMLSSVSFESPSKVESIGAISFAGASNLSSIAIPTSVTIIDQLAFYLASNLKSITIPSSVTYIGQWAFLSASSLASVYFEGAVAPGVGTQAFDSVSSPAMAYHIAGATGFDTVGSTPPLWNGLQVAEYLPAPKAPVAVAGVERAEVTVTPAGFGRAAASYWVTASPASPGGSVCEIKGASGMCAIYGLTAGVSYTFTAVARTTDPSLMSYASVASNAVVPNPIASSVSSLGSSKQRATGMTVTILASEPGLVKMLVVEAGDRALRAKPLVVCSVSKNVKSATRFPLKCNYSKAVRVRLAKKAMQVTISLSFTPTTSHLPSTSSKSLTIKRLRPGKS